MVWYFCKMGKSGTRFGPQESVTLGDSFGSEREKNHRQEQMHDRAGLLHGQGQRTLNTPKMRAYQNDACDITTTWLLFLFFGWSYGSMGRTGLQMLYYITCGGFGLWTLIRLFTLNDAIKEYNRGVAARVGMDNQEMAALGLM